MLPKLTVDDVKAVLGRYARSDSDFMTNLSEVMARFYDSGAFKDMVATVSLTGGTDTGFITLKRRYLSLLGIAITGTPVSVNGLGGQFSETGAGFYDPDDYTMNGVMDMGDGFCTQEDIVTEGTLRLVISDSDDAGKTVRIFGTSAGKTVFDSEGVEGVNLTTVNTTANTTQTFDKITDIQMDPMVGRSILYVVVSGTPTQLAEFEPGETRPSYRRYKVGVTTQAMTLYCRLRFMPYRDWTDWVVPANIGAIKAGFQALVKEDAMDYVGAEEIWQKAKQLLNEQLKAFRGSARPRVQFMPVTSRVYSPT